MSERRRPHRPTPVVRRAAVTVAGLAVLAGPLAVGAAAQSPAAGDRPQGPLCLLTADEAGELLGAPVASVASVPLQCAYSADPSQRSLQLLLGLQRPDPTSGDAEDDPLRFLRFGHQEGGADTELAGLPAWVADDGAWVNLGPDVLFAWPNVVFDATPPDARAVATKALELAVPRYLEHPAPTPAPTAPPSGVLGRFPAEVAGQSLDPFELEPQDAIAGFLLGDAPDPGARPALLDAVTALAGGSLDAVTAATGTALDFDTGASLTATAIQVPGADASSLVPLAAAALIDFPPLPPETRSIGGRDVTLVAQAPGGEDRTAWFFADGDVLWALDGSEAMVEDLIGHLPPADGAG
ncbi:MAG: hypothetical protein U0869_23705 [Chloroflexota bacterium]